MKNIIIIAIIGLSLSVQAHTTEKITNQKVMELSGKGIGSELIISLFNSNECDFNMDVSSVLELKKNNVGDAVIMEMMKRAKGLTSASNGKSNNPGLNREGGIYAHYIKGDTDVMAKLYVNLVSSANAGGFGMAMAKKFSSGFAKSGVKSEIAGPSANIKCPQSSEFFLYFDPASNNNDFAVGGSPNEFMLIKLSLNKEGNMREIRRGSSDSYSVNTGIDDDQKVAFSFEEIRPNVFVITPNGKLVPGEYCFINIARGNNKIYDFTVQ